MARPKILDAFKVHYKMMITTGIWPIENPSIFYRLRTLTSWFLAIGVTTCMMIEAISDIHDLTKLSETVYIMISWIAYILKLAGFVYNRKIFLSIIDFLEDPIFMSFPEDFDHYLSTSIKFSTFLANALRFACLGIVLLYLVYPILDNVPLPFPFPYDLATYRYFMFAFQLVGEGYAACNNISLDTLCTSLIAMGSAQLDILAEKLVNLRPEEDPEMENCGNSNDVNRNVRQYVKQCVQHHLAIIKLIEMIESVFTFGLLFQFLSTIVVSCSSVFQFMWVTLSWQFFLLVSYLGAMALQVFMYCWYGNELILKSLNIGDACYLSKWQKCDKQVRKYLFIMMERSKRPLQITTLKFSVLSLALFGFILRASYSLLTLLLNMYKKKAVKE